MTDKEKLVGIIDGCRTYVAQKEVLAEHLLSNGVTVQKRGRWIIKSSGKGKYATNWAECSNCCVCGSPQWKVCPVCETKMDPIQVPVNDFAPDDLLGEYEDENA